MPITLEDLERFRAQQQQELAAKGNENPAVNTNNTTDNTQLSVSSANEPEVSDNVVISETSPEVQEDEMANKLQDRYKTRYEELLQKQKSGDISEEEEYEMAGLESGLSLSKDLTFTNKANKQQKEAVEKARQEVLSEISLLGKEDQLKAKEEMVSWIKDFAEQSSGMYQYYKDDEKLNFTDDEWFQIGVDTYNKLTNKSVIAQAQKAQQEAEDLKVKDSKFSMDNENRVMSELDKIIANRIAENQTGLEKLGHMFWGAGNMAVADVGMVVGTLAGLTTFVPNLVYGLFEDTGDENALQYAWRNVLYNSINEWATGLSETGAWSSEEQERLRKLGLSKTGIYGDDFLSFVMNAAQSWGFTAASMMVGMGEAAAIGKILAKGSTKALSKETARLTAEAVKAGREVTQQELNAAEALIRAKRIKLAKNLNSTALPIMGAIPEATMNAVSVKDKIVDDATAQLDAYYDNLCRQYVEQKINERLNQPLVLNPETGQSNSREYSDADIEKWYNEAAEMYKQEMLAAYDHIEDVAERAGSMNFFMDATVVSLSGGLLQSTMLPKKTQNFMRSGKINKIFNDIQPKVFPNADGTFTKKFTVGQKIYALSREPLGEAIEEGVQSLNENTNTAVANWDIEEFVRRQHDYPGIQAVSDGLGTHFGAAFSAFFGLNNSFDRDWSNSVWNAEVFKSAASGAVGSIVGGIGLTHTNKFLFDRGYTGKYKMREVTNEDGEVVLNEDGTPKMEYVTDKNGNKIPERAWFSRGVTASGEKESNWDMAARMIPWRTGVGSQYLEMVSQENGQFKMDADRISRYFKKYHSGDAWEDSLLDGLVGTANTLEAMKKASESGDIFGFKNAATEQLVETAWVLGELRNSSSKTNQTLAQDFLQDLNETANVTAGSDKAAQLLESYKQTDLYKTSSQNQTDEQILEMLSNNAKQALEIIDNVSKVEEQVSSQYSHYNLDQDTKHALIYSKIMIENGNQRKEQIESEIKNMANKTASMQEVVMEKTISDEARKVISKYGGAQAAITRKSVITNDLKKLEENINRLEKAEKEKKISANPQELEKNKKEYAKLLKEQKELEVLKDYNVQDFTLSAWEIMQLPAEQRLNYLMSGYETVWNETHSDQAEIKHIKAHSTEQQQIIDKLRNELLNEDPLAMDKIMDAVKLQQMIGRHIEEQNKIMQDPKKFAEYARAQRLEGAKKVWEADVHRIASLNAHDGQLEWAKFIANIDSNYFLDVMKFQYYRDILMDSASWMKDFENADNKTQNLIEHIASNVSLVNAMSQQEYNALETLIRIGYMKGLIPEDFSLDEKQRPLKFNFNNFIDNMSDFLTNHKEVLGEWKETLGDKGEGLPSTAEEFVQFINPYRGRYNLVMNERPIPNANATEETPVPPSPTQVSPQPKDVVEQTESQETSQPTEETIQPEVVSETTEDVQEQPSEEEELEQARMETVENIQAFKEFANDNKKAVLDALSEATKQDLTQDQFRIINHMLEDDEFWEVLNNNDKEKFLKFLVSHLTLSSDIIEVMANTFNSIVGDNSDTQIEQQNQESQNKTQENVFTSQTGKTSVRVIHDTDSNVYTVKVEKGDENEDYADVLNRVFNSIPVGSVVSIDKESQRNTIAYQLFYDLVGNMQKTNSSVNIDKKKFYNYQKTSEDLRKKQEAKTETKSVFPDGPGMHQNLSTINIGQIANRQKNNPKYKSLIDLYEGKEGKSGIKKTLQTLSRMDDEKRAKVKVFYIIDPVQVDATKEAFGNSYNDDLCPVIAVVEVEEGKGMYLEKYSPIGVLAVKENTQVLGGAVQGEIRTMGISQMSNDGNIVIIKDNEGNPLQSHIRGDISTFGGNMSCTEYATENINIEESPEDTPEEYAKLQLLTWFSGVHLKGLQVVDEAGNQVFIEYAHNLSVELKGKGVHTVTDWLKIIHGSNYVDDIVSRELGDKVFPVKRLVGKFQKTFSKITDEKILELSRIIADLKANKDVYKNSEKLTELFEYLKRDINECINLSPAHSTTQLSYRIDKDGKVVLTLNSVLDEEVIGSFDICNIDDLINLSSETKDFSGFASNNAFDFLYQCFFDEAEKLRESPNKNENYLVPFAKFQVDQSYIDELKEFGEERDYIANYASIFSVAVSKDNKNSLNVDDVTLSSPFIPQTTTQDNVPIIISNSNNADTNPETGSVINPPTVKSEEEKTRQAETIAVQLTQNTQVKVDKLLDDSKAYFKEKESESHEHTGLTVTGIVHSLYDMYSSEEEEEDGEVENKEEDTNEKRTKDTPATILGTKIDTFLRDVLDPSIKWSKNDEGNLLVQTSKDDKPVSAIARYDNLSDAALVRLYDEMLKLMSRYPEYTVYSKGIALTTNIDVVDEKGNIKSVQIHGEPDLVLISPEGNAIPIDFKSTNSYSALTEDSEQRDSYFLQTALYAKALNERGFNVTECIILPISTPKGLNSQKNLVIGEDQTLYLSSFGGHTQYKVNALSMQEFQTKPYSEIAIPQVPWNRLSSIQQSSIEKQLSEHSISQSTTQVAQTEFSETNNNVQSSTVLTDSDMNDLFSQLGFEAPENSGESAKPYNPNSQIEEQKNKCKNS